MSLIICPECKKEISDKADVCIHCGYPIKNDKNNQHSNITKKYVYMCMSCSNPFKEFDEYKGEIQICPDCGNQLEYYETETVDNNTNLVVERYTEETQRSINSSINLNRPQCPYCHSTDTKKITNTSKAVHTALFGIFSMGRNSKQWHCNKCGSDF